MFVYMYTYIFRVDKLGYLWTVCLETWYKHVQIHRIGRYKIQELY